MPRRPRPSPTTATLADTVFSPLAAKAKGREVFPLHVGDTFLEPMAEARAEAQRTGDAPGLHRYAPVQGAPELLDAIEAFHGGRIPRERIQVMSGATAGLSVVVNALLDPGDEVLLPSPFWPLIRGIVAARGAVPVEIPVFDERLRDPGFDLEATLAAKVTDRTAAIYVNTPHNPTGRVLAARHLDAIAEVARAHDLWVLTDEAYERLHYAGDPPPPLWSRDDLADRTVAVHTLSKSHALAGARVGWAHGPAEAMGAIRGLQTFHTYCAPRPMQRGAAVALARGDAWLEQTRALYRESGRRAAAALGVDPPAGGTFLFLDTRPHQQGGEGTMGFLERCLDAGVLLTPGASCGTDFAEHARLCFTSVPPEVLDEALARLTPLLRR